MSLDCRSLAYRLLSLPDDARLVICNTMVRHNLASGEYNQRRAECAEAVRILSQRIPTIRALRDVSATDLAYYGDALAPTILRRCRHVLSENARVLAGESCLEMGDLKGFGKLMRSSHQSLRDEYEVSCPE